ncbi:uncharacterized protein LOC112043849 isoform X2 [Bicyclus anynana]|uniref:Uncharacterized protein LOC112043849 isoform X2 n=1 Tax=Bicyclus anynana TaxID=110368 RepID=A0ABM3LYW5_BICAN|nr:uncharacterized protein LOC112043849 isoform X2 [Bicyclus anynana]
MEGRPAPAAGRYNKLTRAVTKTLRVLPRLRHGRASAARRRMRRPTRRAPSASARSPAMSAARTLAVALAALLAAHLALASPHPRLRRQLAADDALQPLDKRTRWSPSPPSTARARSSPRAPRQAARPTDDIPEFDRNKVSLDFPGNLFGPSVSLLIRTTKIIGDVIQNSAVRYQSFLRLFRPLFRGQFEIKGLDPPTTTTTTTARPAASSTTSPDGDNEISRRR